MIPKKNQIKVTPPPTTDTKFLNYKNIINSIYDKGTDRSDLDEILKQVSPDIDILNNLIQFEKKIDALVRRKKFDLQEIHMKPAKKFKKILRVHIIDQNDKLNYHRLKIKGYLFPSNQQTKEIKFTSFFKQIGLKFSNQNYVSTSWKKSQPNSIEKDGIVMNLACSEKTNLEISFHMLHNPPKFKIDPYLQKIVKIQTGTRIAILEGIWQYIKIHKLQDSENKEIVNLDELMKNAFKCQKMPFSSINGRIRQLLTLSDPIIINLSLSEKYEQKIFDFVVEVQGRPKLQVMPFLAQKIIDQRNEKSDNPYSYLNQKIKKIEKAIQDHTQKLRRHTFKRQIYKNYNQNTIQQIVKQQHELLKELNVDTEKKQDINQMEFLLQNEDEVEKQIKNYLEQINVQRGQ